MWSTFPNTLAPTLLVCCSGGVYRVIYAFGLGYGLSMAVSGYSTLLELAPGSIEGRAACYLYIGYGARLAAFILRRQSSAAFASSTHGQAMAVRLAATPLPVKIGITLFVTGTQLLLAHGLQPIAAARPGSTTSTATAVALAVSAAGFLLEVVADEQKQARKAIAPNAPVLDGLYSWVRHPNYLGEIVFWGGLLVAGQLAAAPNTWWGHRLLSAAGPLQLVFVMIGAADRLDARGIERYGDNEGFKAWAATTPSLWPRFF